MDQTPEARAFLSRIAALPPGPGVSLDDALQPSLDDESELRRLFATDKSNARLVDPYVGLINVFEAPLDIRRTRARVIKDEIDRYAKHVMPLDSSRRVEGTPCIVDSLEEFQNNWSIFTEGSLSQLFDWNNVVAAGGSVLACMAPLPEESKVSKRAIRKYYHSNAFPTSDVDLFLWGLTPEQAEIKINDIYVAVRDSVPWDVTCVRTKHTVSIHSQYPYRSVQIVLRLYTSPAEILAGFDVDAPCCAYDGNKLLANPRAIVAMMRQCNTVDVTRRSPSYEIRLAKYSTRGFEVYVPSLRREKIDPTIFERSIARIEGLARLLVLENFSNNDTRERFVDSRRSLRGRLSAESRNRKRKRQFKGDLKGKTLLDGLEMNDYDVASLHIPYGPGWDARRIEKLIYQTDLGMNSTFNPKNKGRRLHRHPAFFGTMLECIGDCCEHCPEPVDEDERLLQEKEDDHYIRGRIKFIEENPGRQSISGSFNPIDTGEWSEQVYIKPIQQFFSAIAANDRNTVQQMIQEGIDVNCRDHVGRAALHLAIMCKATEIARDLIYAGARMTARLVDGRTSLHLAAQYDLLDVIRELFEKSALNAEHVEDNKMDQSTDNVEEGAGPPSSEDDWSSGADNVISCDDDMDVDDDGDDEDNDEMDGDDSDSDSKKTKPKATPADDILEPEEDGDELDILDLHLTDWDFGFSAFSYAVLFASMPVIEELISSGADVSRSNAEPSSGFHYHPLTLTLLREDEDAACKIIKRLLIAGATSSMADDKVRTIFHTAVWQGNPKIVSTLLQFDSRADTLVNLPMFADWGKVAFPLVTAISRSKYSTMALLLANEAKVIFDEEDVTRAREVLTPKQRRSFSLKSDSKTFLDQAYLPIEVALYNFDDVVLFLLKLGAEVDIIPVDFHGGAPETQQTIRDWVTNAISEYTSKLQDKRTESKSELNLAEPLAEPYTASSWREYSKLYMDNFKLYKAYSRGGDCLLLEGVEAYLQEVKQSMSAKKARLSKKAAPTQDSNSDENEKPRYKTLSMNHVPAHQNKKYDELFEACFEGDNKKIERLFFPSKEKGASRALEISVEILYETYQYVNTGLTPLYAAVCKRHWNTAKLILAIADAQYQKSTTEEKSARFDARDITLDNDDDDDDNESMASDDTVQKSEVQFVDIANRQSEVRSDVSPQDLLDQSTSIWRTFKDGEKVWNSGNLLNKAASASDFEGFIKIADLYKTLPESIDITNENVFQSILDGDQVEMLDEYIRRTGYGLNFKSVQKESTAIISVVNDKNKIYLGLNVQGKKRKDLATRNDPNAENIVDHVDPLLWKAAQYGSKRIVEYLESDRPLAAYRYYASSHSDEIANYLRRVPELDKVLPSWLGWKIDSLGESPLTAAILGNQLEIIRLLFKKSKQLMVSALRESVKFIGYNPLMLAVHRNCSTEMIDFLLSKSVSPMERDKENSWNIYHRLCEKKHADLLEHLLRVLPRDVNEELLAQQSKIGLDTPLHLAVNVGAKRLVKLICQYTAKTTLIRNAEGSIPLHIAVRREFPDIIKSLLDAGPADALYTENAVGNTVFEIISLERISRNVRDTARVTSFSPRQLSRYYVPNASPRYDIESLEIELPRLRRTIGELSGKSRKNAKLERELNAFATLMESRLAQAKEEKKKNPVDNDDGVERSNLEASFKIIAQAIEATPGNRRLVHLMDVQKSVEAALVKSRQRDNENEDDKGEDDKGNDEDDERGMVFRFL